MDRTRLGIVTACTVGNIVSMTPAVHAVFGLFLIPLSETFGWPRAAISGVLGVIAVTGAIVLPLAGRMADRYGVRRLALVGNLALAAMLALLAFTNGSLALFYLTFAGIAVAGSIPSSPLYAKMVSDWFDARRGAMLGISAGLGNALGSTLLPIAAAVMMPLIGWRGAYAGIAAIVLGLGFPVLFLLLRDAPRHAIGDPAAARRNEGATLRQAMRMPAFWLIAVAIATGAGCLTAIFSHVVPILAERGISTGTATAVISTFALTTAVWQISLGVALDRLPSARLVTPFYLAGVGGIAVLASAGGTAGLLAGGLLLGIALGTQYGALPYLVARYFGLRSFGAIVGVLYSAVSLAQGLTPVLLDRGYDVQGSYATGLVIIGVCLSAGAALLLLLPPYRSAAAVPAAALHV
ncbi:MAG: MFS transporter [Sphingomonas sp.]